MFLRHYTECFDESGCPSLFEKREFAALLLRNRIMVRHKKFATFSELKSFLCSLIPSDVYYSSAYYEQPEALEMNAKGWIGGDLIFDIDADHIPTSCDKVHDEWTCGGCGFAGKGITPEKCPACGSEKFEDSTWPCETCLASAKAETIKLLDILMRDFGFSQKEMRVFFSGHRGYHVQIESTAVAGLDVVARKEIVDYVCGLGFDAGSHGLDEKDLQIFKLTNAGWSGRISKATYNFILNSKPEDYKDIRLKRNVVETITKNKNEILRNWDGSQRWRAIKGVGPETWKRIIEHSGKSQCANVDTVVTTDIHRLIRLAGALHGKTGFKKVEFPVSAIDVFDPFVSAIAFKGGATTVFVSDAPQFRLGDKTFGPYKNQEIELPTAAALLLVCRKRAEVAERNV
jgi:DNA primase small subunit